MKIYNTNERVSKTKTIFRIINDDLDKITITTERDKHMIVQKLKQINEELCDFVVAMVRKDESLKQNRNDKSITSNI